MSTCVNVLMRGMDWYACVCVRLQKMAVLTYSYGNFLCRYYEFFSMPYFGAHGIGARGVGANDVGFHNYKPLAYM